MLFNKCLEGDQSIVSSSLCSDCANSQESERSESLYIIAVRLNCYTLCNAYCVWRFNLLFVSALVPGVGLAQGVRV